MNQPRIAADWTSRKSYQEQYRKDNREDINQRKREWRKARKEGECPNCGKQLIVCNGNCIFDGLPNKRF